MASVLCFLPPMLETSFQCQAPVASAWAQAIPLQTCKQWTSRSEFSSCLFLSAFHKKWNVFLELFWNVFVSCWKISMTTEYLQEVFLFGARSVWTNPFLPSPLCLTSSSYRDQLLHSAWFTLVVDECTYHILKLLIIHFTTSLDCDLWKDPQIVWHDY